MDIWRLKNLATDEIMSVAELKEKRIFKKIPYDKIKYYIYSPIDIGKKEAEKILSVYKDKNISDICKMKKIDINVMDDEIDSGLVKIRGKYDNEKNRIDIYNSSLKNMEEKFKKLKLGNILSYNNMLNIQLAHEFFHYLEHQEIGLTYKKLDKVVGINLGFFKKAFFVTKTSEIAAHIFCKKVLNLSFHPKLIDYLYLISRDYIDVKCLEDYMKELKNFTSKERMNQYECGQKSYRN